ncbi:MAG: transposase, partial [Sedimentisphaerales bacterium]|nr:transposase [Sedimentisphaerales bacterium]
MSNYRRANFPGGYYFFTLVTHQRKHFLTDNLARACLRHAWQVVRKRRPFDLVALCLLPNHLHCIWRLPDEDADFSRRWNSIKAIFTREYLRQGGQEGMRNPSRKRAGEAAIWQRRFWEHQIRDENDLQRHVDYIHYNPVKHHLTSSPFEWQHSSLHEYLE